MSYELKTIYGAAPQTTRGEPFLITADPKKGETFLYCCGTSVFIRNFANPMICDQYTEHSQTVTAARYSPSGYYIASGDVEGKIRIWDTVNIEHVLKFELKALTGPIRDIQWSGDSKRIIAVGEGKESFANAFMWDSGATVGTITGHSKTIYSCDFRSERPFRIATGGLDQQCNFYEGPPFKFHHSLKDHKRFINCVRFSPNGKYFLTVGSDMLGFLYDGKAGTMVGELGTDNAHKGGIYGCAWSPDSTQFITCSADKTVKLWDAETRSVTTTMNITEKPAVEDMQLGCLWSGSWMLSVSYGGDINYMDPREPSRPTRIVRGHNKSATTVTYDPVERRLITGSYDGRLLSWDYDTGDAAGFEGKGHTNCINKVATDQDGNVVTVAMDDSIRFTPKSTRVYGDRAGFDSCPNGVAVGQSLTVVACYKSLEVLRGEKQVFSLPTSFVANAVALNENETVAVVGGDDLKLHVYSIEGDELKETQVVEKHRGVITDCKFSPDGSLLASSDANREIFVWDAASMEVKIQGWCFHNSRITNIAWAPDSQHLASCSVDTSVIIWSVNNPTKRIMIKGVHLSGGCNGVTWVDNRVVASVGKDCTMKAYELSYNE